MLRRGGGGDPHPFHLQLTNDVTKWYLRHWHRLRPTTISLQAKSLYFCMLNKDECSMKTVGDTRYLNNIWLYLIFKFFDEFLNISVDSQGTKRADHILEIIKQWSFDATHLLRGIVSLQDISYRISYLLNPGPKQILKKSRAHLATTAVKPVRKIT